MKFKDAISDPSYRYTRFIEHRMGGETWYTAVAYGYSDGFCHAISDYLEPKDSALQLLAAAGLKPEGCRNALT